MHSKKEKKKIRIAPQIAKSKFSKISQRLLHKPAAFQRFSSITNFINTRLAMKRFRSTVIESTSSLKVKVNRIKPLKTSQVASKRPPPKQHILSVNMFSRVHHETRQCFRLCCFKFSQRVLVDILVTTQRAFQRQRLESNFCGNKARVLTMLLQSFSRVPKQQISILNRFQSNC